MNILSLNISDLGGLSYNLCEAINDLTSHHALNVVSCRPFTKKPVMWNTSFAIRKHRKWYIDKMKFLIEQADVLHINEHWQCIKRYNIKPELCEDKTVIYHVHGTKFRRNSDVLLNKFRKSFPQLKIITSTPDLIAYAKEATWFPSIIPIEQYRQQYIRHRNYPPTIYYSPSGSSNKEMREVIQRCTDELKWQGLKFKLAITRKTPHHINLEKKAKADIYYDEIYPSPFYGVNAIEAATFELAVICNMNWFARKYVKRNKIKCPFLVIEDERNLIKALKKLIKNKSYREEIGKKGYKYAKKIHSPKVCIERFLKLIE